MRDLKTYRVGKKCFWRNVLFNAGQIVTVEEGAEDIPKYWFEVDGRGQLAPQPEPPPPPKGAAYDLDSLKDKWMDPEKKAKMSKVELIEYGQLEHGLEFQAQDTRSAIMKMISQVAKKEANKGDPRAAIVETQEGGGQ